MLRLTVITYAIILQGLAGHGELVKESPGPNSSITVWISNLNNVALEAYQATYTCNDGTSVRILFDSYFNRHHDQPIQPSGSNSFSVDSHYAACRGGVEAVIFSDGSSDGLKAAAEAIFTRREGLAHELQTLVGVVQEAIDQQLSYKELSARLESLRSTISSNSTLDADRRAGYLHAIDIVEANLKPVPSALSTASSNGGSSADLNSVGSQESKSIGQQRRATVRIATRWAADIHNASSEVGRGSF
jgi:hypothetical protein